VRRITEKFSHDSWFPIWDSNQIPLEHKFVLFRYMYHISYNVLYRSVIYGKLTPIIVTKTDM
jgi:hypothetical protein